MGQSGGEAYGLRLLSLDGGGPGTISQLRILQEYVTRLAPDKGVGVDEVLIADLADLIGGVGPAGFVALLLGPLRMPVSQAIKELIALGAPLFPNAQEGMLSLEENLKKGMLSLEEKSKKEMLLREENSKKLKEAIEAMLKRHNYAIDIKLNDPCFSGSQCKTVVFATSTVDATRCQLFRTYSARKGFLECTFVQAACATLSMSSLFEPVPIGPEGREQTFMSASIGFNNPTKGLINEAKMQFGPDTRVSTILSIGSGLPALVAFDGPTSGSNKLLNDIVIDCEKLADEMAAYLSSFDGYLRLNVGRGLERMEMSNWGNPGKIEGQTVSYITVSANTNAIDSSLERLQNRVSSLTLRQLTEPSPTNYPASEVTERKEGESAYVV